MPQGSHSWCSLPLGWGPLPSTAHGRRRAPPLSRQDLRSPDVQEPGQGRAPTPAGLPQLPAAQQTLELLLAAVLRLPVSWSGRAGL